MKRNFIISWSIANAIGLSLGFLAFIQTLMFYAYGFNFDLHWDIEADENSPQDTVYLITGLALGLSVFGLVYTSFQAIVLRSYLQNIWQWIAFGAVGFLLILLIILPFLSIWGHIPGPVEPFAIVFGGTLFTLLLQFRYLRKQGIAPARPILWYVVGIVAGLAILFLLYLAGMNVSWPLAVAFIGFVVGCSAGVFSAKHFYKALHKGTL